MEMYHVHMKPYAHMYILNLDRSMLIQWHLTFSYEPMRGGIVHL
jgi:hypothetical protein